MEEQHILEYILIAYMHAHMLVCVYTCAQPIKQKTARHRHRPEKEYKKKKRQGHSKSELRP
jgi:hypothetical protein